MRSTVTRLMGAVWELEAPTDLVDVWMARRDLIDAFEFSRKGNPNFLDQRVFSEDDEALLKAQCDWAADCGFIIDAAAVQDIMMQAIREERICDLRTGTPLRRGPRPRPLSPFLPNSPLPALPLTLCPLPQP